MKILLIMDPGIPIPPPLYGGHERLVAMLAQEYTRLGHAVTLLAGPESEIDGSVYSFGKNDLGRGKFQKLKELFFVWKFLWKKRNDFDLIHNFGRLAYLFPVLNTQATKIMTYGRPVSKKGVLITMKIPHRNFIFTGCSDYCVSTGNIAGTWKTIYNCIDFSKYSLNKDVPTDAPLIFLGRLDRIKGAHTAIDAAVATGHKILIAGNIPQTEDNLQYFQEILKPKFSLPGVVFLGPLNDVEKNTYLRQAKALLFPIEWNEPFGMVMAEAMACGTPVIGFNKGSVPEVIENGVTGYAVNDIQALKSKISEVSLLNRSEIRQNAKKRFDLPVIAANYLKLLSITK